MGAAMVAVGLVIASDPMADLMVEDINALGVYLIFTSLQGEKT